jgi:hypothetical protein
MQQDPALEQWEACLSVRTAFDPLHFIDKPLNHAVAPGQTTSVGHRLRIIGQPVDKSDQFRNPSGLDSGFPLLQAHLPLTLSRASDQNPAPA